MVTLRSSSELHRCRTMLSMFVIDLAHYWVLGVRLLHALKSLLSECRVTRRWPMQFETLALTTLSRSLSQICPVRS